MLADRENITTLLKRYLENEQYTINPQSKNYHSLNSLDVSYINSAGMKDNIKIEINYSLRSHIFEPKAKKIELKNVKSKNEIMILDRTEIFASKINALLGRGAVRDLYDVNNMIERKIFKDSDIELLRKSFVFYTAISQEEIPKEYSFEKIEIINNKKIFSELLPVLHNGTFIKTSEMKKTVEKFYSNFLMPTEQEKEFLTLFSQKKYVPELLFSNIEILKRIKNHPMVQWKMMEHKK